MFPSSGSVTRRPASLHRVPLQVLSSPASSVLSGRSDSLGPSRLARLPLLGGTTRCTCVSLRPTGRARPGATGFRFPRRLPAAGFCGGDVRASHVPEEPPLCLRPVLRPRQDRCVRPSRRTDMAPAQSTTRAPTTDFRGSITQLGTGCLRFAGWVTPPPRKTRFRSLARRYRAGLITRRVPTKGFRLFECIFLLSQALRDASFVWYSAFSRRKGTVCPTRHPHKSAPLRGWRLNSLFG